LNPLPTNSKKPEVVLAGRELFRANCNEHLRAASPLLCMKQYPQCFNTEYVEHMCRMDEAFTLLEGQSMRALPANKVQLACQH